MPLWIFKSNLLKILSNYIGKIWNLISVFLFVPLYIHYLGVENYAVIGLYSLILALISFADAGMSSAVTKEFSFEGNKIYYKLNILKKLEVLYGGVLVIIFFIILASSSFITKKWLSTDSINFNDLRNYIILIGLGCSIQMIATLYSGAMFGLGKQVEANFYQIVWTTCKSLLVILLFALINSSLYIFFIWQIICNIFYILLLRIHVMRSLSYRDIITPPNFERKIPNHVLKYIGGMTLVAMISAISSQIDKLIVSYYYSLEIFGYYNVVSVLSQIPVFIAIPLASFMFPLLVKYKEDKLIFESIAKKFIFSLYLIIIPAAILLMFYSIEFLDVWTKLNFSGRENTFKILSQSLIGGSLFLAMQFPFYYILLANGKTKYTIIQGFFQLIIGVPLLLYFSSNYGIQYIGFSWLAINFLGFLFVSHICLKYYLKNIKGFYIWKTYIFISFLITLFISGFGYYFYDLMKFNFIFVSIISFILTFFINLFITNVVEGRGVFEVKYLYDFY